MVAGEPDKGINDPVVEELPWHPPNSGGGGSIFPDIPGEDEGVGGWRPSPLSSPASSNKRADLYALRNVQIKLLRLSDHEDCTKFN